MNFFFFVNRYFLHICITIKTWKIKRAPNVKKYTKIEQNFVLENVTQKACWLAETCTHFYKAIVSK